MIILTGPSASGKTEVTKTLIKDYGYKKLVTYTSRIKRESEIDGIDYNFINKEDFIQKINNGFFFEYVLYNDNYYGTALMDITDEKVVILEPNGLKKFKNSNINNIKSFYLDCSEDNCIKFMRKRGDNAESINQRIKNDKNVFDSNKIEGIDYILNSSNLSIDELAKEINQLYKMEQINEK